MKKQSTHGAIIRVVRRFFLHSVAGLCLLWRGSADDADKDLRSTFEELYARLDAAVARQDESEIAALIAEDAVAKTGPVAQPLRAAMLRLMRTAGSSRRSEVRSAGLEGETAVVTVGVRVNAAGKDQGLLMFREVWRRSGAEWVCKEAARLPGESDVPPTGAVEAQAIVDELKARFAKLATVDPGQDFSDLEPLGAAVGDARIVALGEATHGTREFSQIKRRLVQFLTQRKGFTVVAVEGNWPDVSATSAAPSGVTWTGFDMQAVGRAADLAEAYVRRIAPELASAVQESYAVARRIEEDHTNLFLPEAAEAARRAEQALAEFDSHCEEWTRKSSRADWRDARHAATTVVAACAMRVEANGFGYRDRMMARNVEWLANEAHRGEKIILSAHNEHVSSGNAADPAMGGWLRKRFGKAYYSIGTFFRRGEVWATAVQDGQSKGEGAWPVAASPEGTGDAVLNAAGSLFFLDVRRVPPDTALGVWLAAPHRFNRAGRVVMVGGPGLSMATETVAESYDGIIFVEESHATSASK